MGETKKVASTGRFGSRYGVGIRKKVLKVESLQIKKKSCPNCGSNSVKRKSAGIFFCSKCSHEFVGGAYLPKTLTGKIISQMVSQKKFAPSELEEVSSPKEESDKKIEVSVETKKESKEKKESKVSKKIQEETELDEVSEVEENSEDEKVSEAEESKSDEDVSEESEETKKE